MKRFLALLLGAMLMMGSFAMAQTTQPDLKALIAENQLAELIKTCQTVTLNAKYYQPDGEQYLEISISHGADGRILYTRSDGYEEYLDNTYLYINDDRRDAPFQGLLLEEGAYAQRIEENFAMEAVSESEEEGVIESRTENGVLTVTTVMPMQAVDQEEVKDYGKNLEYCVEYEFDAQTRRVLCVHHGFLADGERVPYSDVTVSCKDEAIAPPEFVEAMQKAGMRSVTLHYQNQSIDVTAYQGYQLQFIVPEGFAVFADAKRTPMSYAEAFVADEVYILLENEQK